MARDLVDVRFGRHSTGEALGGRHWQGTRDGRPAGQPCPVTDRRLDARLPANCGAVAEWSKALAWKVSIRQNRIEGSNPSRSANPLSQHISEQTKAMN